MQVLISLTCADLLTDEELKEMGFNDGFGYSEEKALAIASRLSFLVADEETLAKCKAVIMEGIRHEAHQECWSKENILEFIEFLKHSGGFQVC